MSLPTSSKRHTKCSVLSCNDWVSPRHRFPHPIHDAHGRFFKWVASTGNADVLTLPPNVVRERKRVCGQHFSPDSYVFGTGKLKKNAVPNQNLPASTELGVLLEVPGVAPGDAVENPKEVISSHPAPVVEMEMELGVPRDPNPSISTHSVVEMEVEDGVELGVPRDPTPEGSVVESGASLGEMTVGDAPSTPRGTHFQLENIDGHAVVSTPTSNAIRRSLFRASCEKRSVRKEGILQELGVKKLVELTPKAKFLYKTNRSLKRSLQRSSKKLISVRKRLRLSKKYFELGWEASSGLSRTVLSFLQSQITQTSKKNKGRRFTLDDKVLALSLMKRSGRAYNFLSRVFALPSRRTLLRLLSRLSFTTGINNGMFDHLSVTVSKKVKDIDRHCILMFDEMSLTPHLDFQEHLDVIEGFEDLGGELRSPRFADKALVFMLRGLRRNYKQPVAFVFPGGSIKTLDLCTLLKDVISNIQRTGLTIHATVCDQGASNVAAVNKLCAETRESVLRSGGEYRGDYFHVNGMKIIPLFDPPHLMKGVRNGLLSKDLKYSSGGVNKVASWRHVLQVYNIDCGRFRALPKLTALHVLPERIPKMKVKYCTQVFSRSLASVMDMLSRRPSHGDLEAEAADTAEILDFFDGLFDSINGKSIRPPAGKPLRCAVSPSSGHVEFWNKAQKFLQSMVYTNGSKESRTPSLINWGRTITNIKALWRQLHTIGFKNLALRNLNQDPLENKFGSIRSYGFRNNAPTCSHFVGAYKSLLLNDMVAAHSVGANCQEDDCEVLDNLRSYLIASRSSSSTASSPSVDIHEPLLKKSAVNSSEGIGGSPRMSTALSFAAVSAGNFLKLLGPVECVECKGKQYSVNINDSSATSAQREQWTALRGSSHPSDSFTRVFSTCRDLILKELPLMAHHHGVGTHLKKLISALVDFRYISCDAHHCSYRSRFSSLLVTQTVSAWCNSINRVLLGKDTRTVTQDTIHAAAYTYYTKRRTNMKTNRHTSFTINTI